jgi:hypothetical protein
MTGGVGVIVGALSAVLIAVVATAAVGERVTGTAAESSAAEGVGRAEGFPVGLPFTATGTTVPVTADCVAAGETGAAICSRGLAAAECVVVSCGSSGAFALLAAKAKPPPAAEIPIPRAASRNPLRGLRLFGGRVGGRAALACSAARATSSARSDWRNSSRGASAGDNMDCPKRSNADRKSVESARSWGARFFPGINRVVKDAIEFTYSSLCPNSRTGCPSAGKRQRGGGGYALVR